MARVATAAVVLLPAVVTIGACRGDSTAPSSWQCRRAYSRKTDLLAEGLDRESAKLLRAAYATGTDAYVARCQERMTSKQTTCIREAKNADAADACWPEVDRRPPDQRPSAAECEALAAHIDAISNVPSAAGFTRERCLRSMLRGEVECERRATKMTEAGACDRAIAPR